MKPINRKHIFCVLFCMAILCGMLVSCQKEPPHDSPDSSCTAETTDSGESEAPPAKQEIIFPKSDMNRFKIVYADGSSDEVVQAAHSLSKLIFSSCGYELIITNDFLREGSSTFCEYEYEILIGKTNRKESIAFTETLRQDDYGYTCTDTKIVIAAHDDYTLTEAVNNFTAQIVMGKKSDKMFFGTAWEKVSKGNYNIDNFTLNGISIKDYRIVYPVRSSLFEKELASKLQLAIADASGYMLPITTDRASEGDSKPEILIGATTHTSNPVDITDHNGYIAGNQTTISLYGKNASGNAEAVNAFLVCMTSATQNKTCVLAFSDRQIFTPDHSTVKTMSFNLLTSNMSASRTQRVLSTILRSLPDTFGVQEANVNWMSALNNGLGDYYASVGTGTQSTNGKGNEHCAIFYNKERFRLVESNTYWLTSTPTKNSVLPGCDYPRIYTYVILEDNITKERFLHLNTHLDTAGSEIRLTEVMLLLSFLENHNDIPVILSGDLNAVMDSPEMRRLFANGLIQSEDALGRSERTPTFVGSQHLIDYILATTDCIEVLDYFVDNERIFGDYASDHYAIIMIFRFKDMPDGINHNWSNASSASYS